MIKTGIELIADERKRQIEEEGYTAEHDKLYYSGELAAAAEIDRLVAKLSVQPVGPDFDPLDWHCPKCGKRSCNTHCD